MLIHLLLWLSLRLRKCSGRDSSRWVKRNDMPALLIKSGTLITASETFVSDILVEGEKITQIGSNLEATDASVINAAGKLVMPGGVDPTTHFDLPMFGTVSSDDHYSGHKAAAFGGTPP